jgi:hypothetical protein
MSATHSPGARFRDALAAEKPLQVIGAINANRRQDVVVPDSTGMCADPGPTLSE